MTTFKCKMCGGSLEINANQTTATCEYCGTNQTLPRLDDDRRANLYDRANHFRRNNEFDKAMSIYETILTEDNTDAEAYWSLVLCRYGIEYVEDPATKRRVPTVNRAQFTSVFDDDNYKSALRHADAVSRSIYEAEAAEINEIQKGILAISQKEEPFDVFICYKEIDNNGRRTPDSVLANDLYHQLTQEGFKVFFARITLEDKLGTAYEPYIFAALNSAKVMVVLGTKPEYFNAVWVKNEWSRYLALVKNSGGKKVLIPAYRDMAPYDLPEEFSHLQAQDMSKLGFMQDLIRGIKKLVAEPETVHTTVKETVVMDTAAPAIAPLLKRAFMYLEDGEWQSADEYCEKVLDRDPENAEAYLARIMVDLQVKTRDGLRDYPEPFDSNPNYKKVFRFGDEQIKRELSDCTAYIEARNTQAAIVRAYDAAKALMISAKNEEDFLTAAEAFDDLDDYADARELAESCRAQAQDAKLAARYQEAQKYEDNAPALMNNARFADAIKHLEQAIKIYTALGDWRDAEGRVGRCRELIEDANCRHQTYLDEQEKKRQEQERIEEEKRLKEMVRKKRTKQVITVIAILLLLAALAVGVWQFIEYYNSPASLFSYKQLGSGITITGIKNEKRAVSESGVLEIPEAINGYAVHGIGNYAIASPKVKTVKLPTTIASIDAEDFSKCANLAQIDYAGSVSEWNQLIGRHYLEQYLITHAGACAFGDWGYVVGFDCVAGGEEAQFCLLCDNSVTRAVAPGEHAEVSIASGLAPTCTKDGYTEEHTCPRCQKLVLEKKIIPATGHTVASYETIVSTCTEAGAHGGTYCTVCDEMLSKPTETAALGHDYGAWKTTKAAECVTAGLDQRTCSRCDAVETKKIDSLGGHTYGNWTVSIAPSCVNNGTEIRKCTRCSETESRGVNSLGGHIFGEWQRSVAPSCFTAGQDIRRCTRCSASETRTVAAIGAHAFGNWYDTVAATCLDGGKTARTCTRCGASEAGTSTALDHSFVSGKCSRCGQATPSDGLTYELNKGGTYTVTGLGTCTANRIVIADVYNGKRVTEIGNSAFANCSWLEEVAIPNTVVTIAMSAFHSCTGLKNMVIPNSVKTIGFAAFSGCSSMYSIHIGSGVSEIEGYAFSDVRNLNEVHITDLAGWCSAKLDVFSSPFYASQNATLYIDGIVVRDLVIPAGVTTIKRYVFEDCKTMESITLPEGVTEIEFSAFDSCVNVKKIYVPSTMNKINWCNFGDSRDKAKVEVSYNGTRAQWRRVEISRDSYFVFSPVHCLDGTITD